jgi:hypothetical protein
VIVPFYNGYRHALTPCPPTPSVAQCIGQSRKSCALCPVPHQLHLFPWVCLALLCFALLCFALWRETAGRHFGRCAATTADRMDYLLGSSLTISFMIFALSSAYLSCSCLHISGILTFGSRSWSVFKESVPTSKKTPRVSMVRYLPWAADQ